MEVFSKMTLDYRLYSAVVLPKPIISVVFPNLFSDTKAPSVSYYAGYRSVEGHILHFAFEFDCHS